MRQRKNKKAVEMADMIVRLAYDLRKAVIEAVKEESGRRTFVDGAVVTLEPDDNRPNVVRIRRKD